MTPPRPSGSGLASSSWSAGPDMSSGEAVRWHPRRTPSTALGGRGFYGAVTVSERGQIALPAQARRDLGIKPGDKLLVLGDPEHEQLVAGLDAEVPPGLGGECDLAALADRDRAVEAPASRAVLGVLLGCH